MGRDDRLRRPGVLAVRPRAGPGPRRPDPRGGTRPGRRPRLAGRPGLGGAGARSGGSPLGSGSAGRVGRRARARPGEPGPRVADRPGITRSDTAVLWSAPPAPPPGTVPEPPGPPPPTQPITGTIAGTPPGADPFARCRLEPGRAPAHDRPAAGVAAAGRPTAAPGPPPAAGRGRGRARAGRSPADLRCSPWFSVPATPSASAWTAGTTASGALGGAATDVLLAPARGVRLLASGAVALVAAVGRATPRLVLAASAGVAVAAVITAWQVVDRRPAALPVAEPDEPAGGLAGAVRSARRPPRGGLRLWVARLPVAVDAS